MNICDNCAIRLFNTKHHNLQGVGNPFYGNCIVIPNVDYDAYKKGDISFSSQVKIIKAILHPSTGELDDLDGLDDIYIVPLIRCNESISCELDDSSYLKCLYYFSKDVFKYQFKRILLLGDAGRRFLHCDITENLNNIMLSHNKRFYNINYSPLIKYVNEDKYEVFKEYLLKWYAWCKSNINTYNKIIEI